VEEEEEEVVEEEEGTTRRVIGEETSFRPVFSRHMNARQGGCIFVELAAAAAAAVPPQSRGAAV